MSRSDQASINSQIGKSGKVQVEERLRIMSLNKSVKLVGVNAYLIARQ